MRSTLTEIDTIATAIDYIEENLKSPLTVAAMAEAVSYSQFHFSRIFNQVTHHTPYEYLIRRRLSEAACLIPQSEKRIIEIALDYQFNNHETFSRAFKRAFGLQPNQLRKRETLDPRLLMPRLTLDHLEHIHRITYLGPRYEEMPPLRLFGLMTVINQEPLMSPHLWDLLELQLKEHKLSRMGRRYGLYDYPPGWEKYGRLYTAAIEVSHSDKVYPPLISRTIPGMHYFCFIHKGSTRRLPLTLDFVYHTWTSQSGKRLSYRFFFESYKDSQESENIECERILYFPIEK